MSVAIETLSESSFSERFRLISVCPLLLALFICSGCTSHPVQPEVAVIGRQDNNPAWSNAGDRVAYFSWVDSAGARAPGIYIVDSLGQNPTPITQFGYFAKWLPGDSELVVNDAEGMFIYGMWDSSRTHLPLFPNSPPFDLSPDGRFVYYNGKKLDSSNPSGIYKYDIQTDSVWRLSEGGHPAISPDGTKLAYARGPVFVFNLSDSNTTQISSGSGQLPTWTRDGKFVIYNDTRTQLLLGSVSSPSTPLINGFGALSLSPDGDKMLFNSLVPDSEGYQHIWLYSFSDQTTRQFIR